MPPQKQDQQKPGTGSLKPLNAQDAMQLKAFTRWWSTELKQAEKDLEVSDFTQDLATGVVPVALLEVLTKSEIKYNKEPKNRLKMIENCAIFIRQLKGLGITVAHMSAEDVADGKKSVMPTLTWKLILHFQSPSKESTLPDDLLRWVQLNTEGYSGASVTGWADNLASGRALCALLHRYDSSVLDYEALPEADADGAELAALSIGFDAAESRFGAPKLLDAADLVAASTADAAALDGGNDPKALQAYVVKLRQALRHHRAARSREVGAQCAAFLAEVGALDEWAREAARMQRDRTTLAQRLERTNKKDVAEADAMLTTLEQTFRGGEKAGKAAQRDALTETALPTIHAALDAHAAADARFFHSVPGADETLPATDAATESLGGATPAAPAAEALAELTTALSTLEAAWAEMEAAEARLSDCLWEILVEKKTDLMVAACEAEAAALEQLAKDWTARLSAVEAVSVLRFQEAAPVPWAADAGDAVVALESGVALLEAWASGTESPLLQSVVTLETRKERCLTDVRDATRRRGEEGRALPADPSPRLSAAWQEMENVAAELNARVEAMSAWQRQQLEMRRAQLGRVQRILGPRLLRKPARGATEPGRTPAAAAAPDSAAHAQATEEGQQLHSTFAALEGGTEAARKIQATFRRRRGKGYVPPSKRGEARCDGGGCAIL